MVNFPDLVFPLFLNKEISDNAQTLFSFSDRPGPFEQPPREISSHDSPTRIAGEKAALLLQTSAGDNILIPVARQQADVGRRIVRGQFLVCSRTNLRFDLAHVLKPEPPWSSVIEEFLVGILLLAPAAPEAAIANQRGLKRHISGFISHFILPQEAILPSPGKQGPVKTRMRHKKFPGGGTPGRFWLRIGISHKRQEIGHCCQSHNYRLPCPTHDPRPRTQPRRRQRCGVVRACSDPSRPGSDEQGAC